MPQAIFYAREEARKIFHPLGSSLFTISSRFSVLPAITLDGMLHCSVVEGSFNTVLFTGFIHKLLSKMNRFPQPKSVVVMDNCVIHKAPEIREVIESRYEQHCVLRILMY